MNKSANDFSCPHQNKIPMANSALHTAPLLDFIKHTHLICICDCHWPWLSKFCCLGKRALNLDVGIFHYPTWYILPLLGEFCWSTIIFGSMCSPCSSHSRYHFFVRMLFSNKTNFPPELLKIYIMENIRSRINNQ